MHSVDSIPRRSKVATADDLAALRTAVSQSSLAWYMHWCINSIPCEEQQFLEMIWWQGYRYRFHGEHVYLDVKNVPHEVLLEVAELWDLLDDLASQTSIKTDHGSTVTTQHEDGATDAPLHGRTRSVSVPIQGVPSTIWTTNSPSASDHR